ncbi:MAG: hypothetical protein AB8C02_14840 [Halioglobus sp.]
MFSTRSRLLHGAVAGGFVVALVSLFGCDQADTPSPEETPDLQGAASIESAADSTMANKPQVSIAKGTANLADGYTAQGRQVAEGYGMAYSETALDEVIPGLPLFGFANGQPFNAGTVIFREDHKGAWHLEVSDYGFDPAKGSAAGRQENQNGQTAYLSLAREPAPGAPLGQTMQYGGGYFQIRPHPDANTTTSWNTSLAYKLEIATWEKEKSVPGSCGVPSIGSATGKLFVSFKGSEEEGRVRNSWLSGQFTGASIVYCGE